VFQVSSIPTVRYRDIIGRTGKIVLASDFPVGLSAPSPRVGMAVKDGHSIAPVFPLQSLARRIRKEKIAQGLPIGNLLMYSPSANRASLARREEEVEEEEKIALGCVVEIIDL